MKRWYGLIFLFLACAEPCFAQDLSGVWQGEADNRPKSDISPVEMIIDKGNRTHLTGSLYQEFDHGDYYVLYRLRSNQSAKTLIVEFDGVLKDRHPNIPNYRWDAAPVAFTYDEREEKLVGRNPPGKYTRSSAYTFTLYRVKLKSSPQVPVAASTTMRVSGHDVRWFSDPALKHLVNQGNTFSTRLQKTTAFYIMQGFKPSRKNAATVVTIRVKPDSKRSDLKPVAKKRPLGPAPATVALSAPVLLPTVLFYTGTAKLLPTATPALAQLTAELKDRPALRVRIAGHTDRVGEPEKNQVLSEQRAAAVKTFLMQAGIAPDRMETVGYGDTRELYPTPDVRNRRVEIIQVR